MEPSNAQNVLPRVPGHCQLLRAHVDEHQHPGHGHLGDLITTDRGVDINLLRNRRGVAEPPVSGHFPVPVDLPLRGQLRLYFLAPRGVRGRQQNSRC